MANSKRVVSYIAGMLILALGLSLNTRTTLGVSPMLSIAYSSSQIYDFNFGNATLVLYIVFVLIEIAIHVSMKRYKNIIVDVAQIALSIVFTRFLNVFNSVIPEFEVDFEGTFFGTVYARLFFLIIAIILTGIGAAMSLNARIIPNPGDGVVQAIADFTKKEVGNVKNVVDISCVCITLVVCFVSKSGIVGIGVGTVMAMLGVGRVIAAYNAFVTRKNNDTDNNTDAKSGVAGLES
ncbi:MAG: DUF6198 family protein [Lachnospiraceae bacterium]|nr:DUF6198 family protein [Lachnospiraceae bacterium]